MWRIWSLALGRKDGRDDREADIIACIRTFILVCYMVTNVAIVANAVRHWNDGQCDNTISGTSSLTTEPK